MRRDIKVNEETKLCDSESHFSEESKLLPHCEEEKLLFLDLNNIVLKILTPDIFKFCHVQWLFLQDNYLEIFPENLFEFMVQLKWLDLRNNKLKKFSGTHLSSNIMLETLLLEDNELAKLPLQLGLLNKLKCISLSGNPLEFPTPEVISQGTLHIRNYLRHIMGSGINDEIANHEIKAKDYSFSEINKAHENQSDAFNGYESHHSDFSFSTHCVLSMDLAECAGASSVKLHPPINHYQIRQQYMERVARGSGAPRQFSNNLLRTQSERHSRLVNMNPVPTSLEAVERKTLDDKRTIRLRELNDRQEAIIQRRRNHEALRGWRDQGKRLQQQSYIEQMKKGRIQIANESLKRLELAPFDLSKDQMTLPNHDEYRRVVATGSVVRDAKPKPLSADKLAMMEAEKRLRELHIQAEIQKHSKEIQERKSHSRGSAQDDIEIARRDLQIMHMLRRAINSPSSGLFTT